MSTTMIDAADLAVIHELKMSTVDMGWLARGLLAAAATNEVYGVICHAHIAADGLSAIAASTDRYRVHQMHLALRAPVEPVDVVLPREALVWASKNVRTFTPKKDSLIEPIATLLLTVAADGDGSRVGWVSVIYREWDDETAPSARFDAPLMADEYPPVGRIIEAARLAESAAPSPVQLDFIADARTLQTAHTETPTITYTTGSTGRPGPAILDFWEGGILRGTALIQPSRTEDDE
ncbi:MAG: hypothetical protein P0Y60_14630 [Candidatus Microbacterium colombiense]|nr:MAG: hypothetical protein P0Y60_14630 [Microbacterium sp.]